MGAKGAGRPGRHYVKGGILGHEKFTLYYATEPYNFCEITKIALDVVGSAPDPYRGALSHSPYCLLLRWNDWNRGYDI